ncbi:MAG: gfo/Idh/MocA family oxidoreductase, partial [Clostridia bacterium]|nr:gfo/Idh/MocA family oxidoreductase [Clostridia bacterium]
EYARLPELYLDEKLPNGHMASHKLLIDDFCTAAYHGTLPKVNAWLAARFTVPGLVAHESAKQGGVLLDVPDFGDAPETL